MPRFYILLIASILLFSCTEREPTIIIVEPQLPKIDCRERARQVGADLSNRGLGKSSIFKKTVDKAKRECEEENERRGY